jgi:hypothetical protein
MSEVTATLSQDGETKVVTGFESIETMDIFRGKTIRVWHDDDTYTDYDNASIVGVSR